MRRDVLFRAAALAEVPEDEQDDEDDDGQHDGDDDPVCRALPHVRHRKSSTPRTKPPDPLPPLPGLVGCTVVWW